MLTVLQHAIDESGEAVGHAIRRIRLIPLHEPFGLLGVPWRIAASLDFHRRRPWGTPGIRCADCPSREPSVGALPVEQEARPSPLRERNTHKPSTSMSWHGWDIWPGAVILNFDGCPLLSPAPISLVVLEIFAEKFEPRRYAQIQDHHLRRFAQIVSHSSGRRGDVVLEQARPIVRYVDGKAARQRASGPTEGNSCLQPGM